MRRAELTFIHPFDDESVIAGQGSIGVEMLAQVPDLDAVVVAVGGGGLISGVACAIKETNSKIKVIGVQTSKLPSMKKAIEQKHLVMLPAQKTIADGIAVRRAGDVTFPLVQKYVDEIVTVDDEEIAKAILLLLEKGKDSHRRRGVAATAAVIQGKLSMHGKRVGVFDQPWEIRCLTSRSSSNADL